MSGLNHGLNQMSQSVAFNCLPDYYGECDKGVTTVLPNYKCLLDKWKKKNEIQYIQIFTCLAVISMTTVLATWQGYLFSNHLFYLAISLGLAASSNNLSLNYLYATCFNTVLYLNTKFLTSLMFNISHIT